MQQPPCQTADLRLLFDFLEDYVLAWVLKVTEFDSARQNLTVNDRKALQGVNPVDHFIYPLSTEDIQKSF
jgi:hypothetical protein